VPPPAAVADLAEANSDDVEALTQAALTELDQSQVTANANRWRDQVINAADQLLTLQAAAVALAPPFLERVLLAQGADPARDVELNPAGFVDFTDGGGSWMRNLVHAPPAAYDRAVAAGLGASIASGRAGYAARAIIANAMRDAARGAAATMMAASRSVKGYVRVLRGATCARCAVLAGRHYRVSAFQRHPLCDCYMIPSTRDRDDWTTNPLAYFRSLDPAEQARRFTKAGAQAIRLGADISQVVNARDGIEIVGGLATTDVGTTRRGLAGSRLQGAPRLLPDEIFQLAEQEGWDRAEVLRQLQRFGYVL